MPYLPQIKILVPSAQVSSYTTGVLSLPSAKGAFVPLPVSRGIVAGGENDGAVFRNTIDYFDITTTGNATDFGDLTLARSYLSGVSSTTRGAFGGEYNGSDGATIDYVTMATLGNAIDFGDRITSRGVRASCSNATRGIFVVELVAQQI
jgi:hypothetical protein